MKQNIIYIDEPYKIKKAVSYMESKKLLGFDTETTGLDPLSDEVILLQLGDSYKQYVFDTRKLKSFLDPVFHLLENESIRKIAHNAEFDHSMLRGNFGIDTQNIACTMIASMLLTKGNLQAKNNLLDCLDKYLGIKISKEEQSSFIGMNSGRFTRKQIEYAGKDIMYLIPLYNTLVTLLNNRGMDILSELEFETVRAISDLRLNGIYLDPKKWLDLEKIAKDEADSATERLHSHFRAVCAIDLFNVPVVNYSSPTQLLPLLQQITGEALESTKDGDLQKINHPVIKDLLAYRKAQKRVTTYGKSFLKQYVHPVTNRVHSSFKQLGADSGRMASREPNMQNIPSLQAYRSCFTAQHEDYRIIAADFSGQELRLLAQISQEPRFIEALKENKDLHSYSASLIFDVPYSDFFFDKDSAEEAAKQERCGVSELSVNNDGFLCDSAGDPVIRKEMKKKYRNPAKSITFGLIYGMGPGKLADTLGINIAEAKSLIDKYFLTFPIIKKVLDDLTEQALKNKYALSPLDGRRRLFSGVDWDHSGKVAHLKNVAKNQPFQGCGASVTKLALCRMKQKIDKMNWDVKLINVVHDEILLEAHKDIAEVAAQALEEVMVSSFNFFAPDVPMVAKAAIAKYWVH